MTDTADPELTELVTLLLLDRASHPIGAARLAVAWRQADLPGAEATAGRYLRQLDQRGLTTPVHSTKGRVLTEQGKRYLHDLLDRKQQDEQRAQLWRAVNMTEITDLIDLLYVRRAVEIEAVRLAALRATDEELAALMTLSTTHVCEAEKGRETTSPAMDFHRKVTEASHNRMLIAVVLFLLAPTNDPLEKILEYIALNAGATINQISDHATLARALQRRDTQAAERIMRQHMDSLINAVETYRDQTERERISQDVIPGQRSSGSVLRLGSTPP